MPPDFEDEGRQIETITRPRSNPSAGVAIVFIAVTAIALGLLWYAASRKKPPVSASDETFHLANVQPGTSFNPPPPPSDTNKFIIPAPAACRRTPGAPSRCGAGTAAGRRPAPTAAASRSAGRCGREARGGARASAKGGRSQTPGAHSLAHACRQRKDRKPQHRWGGQDCGTAATRKIPIGGS